jgi:hypothetical protein
MIFARPFVPFMLLRHGGHVIDVLSPEFITLERAILFLTVYDPSGHRCYVDVEKIVALRTIHAVEE